jgi:hypothetical protein
VNGLEWLNQLMQWLGMWFPRIVLVKRTHEGVKFTTRGRVGVYPPGLYCYWPITTEFKTVSTRQRTTEVAAQLCGREVVSVCVAYTIMNPMSALMAYDDVFSQLDDRTQAHLTRAYSADGANVAISEAIRRGLDEEFGENGVSVHSVDVIQRGWVIPLKNLNDWAQHSKAEL